MVLEFFRDLNTLLDSYNVSLSQCIITLLNSSDGSSVTQNLRQDITGSIPSLFSALAKIPGAQVWIQSYQTRTYVQEIHALTRKGNGWHFSALRASPEQIDDFELQEMADIMETEAPGLWRLFGDLSLLKAGGKRKQPEDESFDSNENLDAEEEEYWNQVNGLTVESLQSSTEGQGSRKAAAEKVRQRRTMVQKIRKVMAVSILMLSHNQKCNMFASILGIFCHANNTPEKVIEVLSRLGVSISIDAINDAITSLSQKCTINLRELGQTLTAAYAYDNLDVDLKTSVPTVEKSTDHLKHLTTGLMFPLPPSVSPDDLRCSRELWESSPLNDTLPDDRPNLAPKPDIAYLLRIHPEYSTIDNEGLSGRDRWNRYKFLYDLVYHGPPYFHQFRSLLKGVLPNPIDAIPVTKTPTFPVRAMDLANSIVGGNIDAIANLLAQGGVGDPLEMDDETLVSIMEHVVVVHGDLGTGERLDGAQLRRAIESSPFLRYQFIIFVLGLFHLKMACADAIWRIFIKPRLARMDSTSIMEDVGYLRPRETGKIISNPGFRRMHEVIEHDGICRRLDCWSVEVKKQNTTFDNLDEYAQSTPSFSDLLKLATRLVRTYVGNSNTLRRLRRGSASQRDEQYENSLLVNQYFLLYEEIIYAMNHRDIGRVEACFAPWVCIFKATGKHKYASAMIKHITYVHFHYPAGLKMAIRHSMLINPSGKEGCFRAVDWVVELYNLFIKRVHGGSGATHTVENIIKESILVQLFKHTHTVLERNLVLSHLTTHHSDPDMTATFATVTAHLAEESPHLIKPGRKTKYTIVNMIAKGMQALKNIKGTGDKKGDGAAENVDEEDEFELTPEEADVLLDLVL